MSLQTKAPTLKLHLSNSSTSSSIHVISPTGFDTSHDTSPVQTPLAYRPRTLPSVKLVDGPMFSGKTSFIVDKANRAIQHQNKKVLVIKYAKDTRYSDDSLGTHDRKDTKYLPTVKATKLGDISKKQIMAVDEIYIDEGQFFEDMAEFIREYRLTHEINIAALNYTYNQNFFAPTIQYLPLVTKHISLESVCCRCKQENATRTIRKDHYPRIFKNVTVNKQDSSIDPSKQAVIGSDDEYAVVCQGCLCQIEPVREVDKINS